MQVKEREVKLQTCQSELDTTQQLLRSCKEEMAEKDGHVKVLKMNLDSSEKQRCHFIDEIHKYEEAVGQFKCVIENSQQKYRQCHAELAQAQQQILDLKAVVSTGEFNNKVLDFELSIVTFLNKFQVWEDMHTRITLYSSQKKKNIYKNKI